MLQVENLTKRFYSLTALHDVTLHIPADEITGILGPNGAGKTTLFRILTGSLNPDRGMVLPENNRWPTIGYKPERLFFPERMTVGAYLHMVARLSPQSSVRVDEIMDQVGLGEVANRPIKQCSKGMRQRIGLAQALLPDPELIILDEPSDGLDPVGQKEIRALIRQLQVQGKTVLISSHQLSEVTEICTQLVILNRGQVIYRNRLADAVRDRPKATIYVDRDLGPVRGLLLALTPSLAVEERKLHLDESTMPLRREILKLLLMTGYDIDQIDRQEASLAEIYAEVTQG